MKTILFLVLLFLCPVAYADGQFTLGFGGVRDYGNLTHYRVETFDWQSSTHVVLNAGILEGKSPVGMPDLSERWWGIGLIENEDVLFDSISLVRIAHENKNLTSPYQCYLVLGIHKDGWSLSYRHLSNGGTGGANYGEDMVVVGFTL